jgi:hypothetical protein
MHAIFRATIFAQLMYFHAGCGSQHGPKAVDAGGVEGDGGIAASLPAVQRKQECNESQACPMGLVCFAGFCDAEPSGPCTKDSCQEGFRCFEMLQKSCPDCKSQSGCVPGEKSGNSPDGGVEGTTAIPPAVQRKQKCEVTQACPMGLVCFAGYCDAEPSGPCTKDSCQEGFRCFEKLQESCSSCRNRSGCVPGEGLDAGG